jgi:hypothetical protein
MDWHCHLDRLAGGARSARVAAGVLPSLLSPTLKLLVTFFGGRQQLGELGSLAQLHERGIGLERGVGAIVPFDRYQFNMQGHDEWLGP